MLVLGRRLDEKIVINDTIIITVIDIKGAGTSGYVRLGVTAPREIPVHRHEIWEDIKLRDEVNKRRIEALKRELDSLTNEEHTNAG